MEINNILTKIAESVGKRKSDITRSYNATLKKTTEKFDGTDIPETTIQKVAMFEVANKFDFNKGDLEELIDSDTASIDDGAGRDDKKPIKTMDGTEITFPDEEVEVVEKPKVPPKGTLSKKAWKNFFNAIPDPKDKEGDYEDTPSLVIHIGGTYTLSLLDPTMLPYKHIATSKNGSKYNVFAIKVTLHKVYPEDLYEEVYEKGKLAGEYLYDDNKHYTLWLNETQIHYFKEYFNFEQPDDRVFTYKRTGTGTNSRYIFADPKTKETKRKR